MKLKRFAIVFAAANIIGPNAGPLSVMRVHPVAPADPRTEIAVTFDRPIAAGLDAMVDAAAVFRIEPAVAGKVEWRDPVTLRFIPAAPLPTGSSYRVTISNDFTATDGTRLARPYVFTVRVAASRVLGGDPVGAHERARFVSAQPSLAVLISAPADPRILAQLGSITMSPQCGGARIGLELVGTRRVTEADGSLRWTGGSYYSVRDSARDMRRIVELRPRSPLPLACAATLHIPAELTPNSTMTAWDFDTYGPLQLSNARCADAAVCPTGPIEVFFTTPVRGADVVRHVRVEPAVKFTVADTTETSHYWRLYAQLMPRSPYAVVVDSLLTDVFGQKLGAVAVKSFVTTSYAPTVTYEHGKLLVERNGLRTLAVQVINVDTLVVTSIAVPASEEAAFLSQTWRWLQPFERLRPRAVEQRIAVKPELDKQFIAGVPMPVNDARTTANGTLIAVRIRAHKQPANTGEIALVQLTDLAVHGKMGVDGGVVWVSGVRDGKARPGATVTVHDAAGKVRGTARTDAQGIARFSELRGTSPSSDCEECDANFDGYVAVVLNDDRAVVGFNAWDPDLAAWHFGISGAWSKQQRIPAAAAVFTERGIYRPGERVYAKAIVRSGTLGSLAAPKGDSLKWLFMDRENGVLKDTVTRLSSFGTADHSIVLGSDVPLGQYDVRLSLKRDGEWHVMSSTSYQVAEYRPPEFLVDVNADTRPRFAGDTLSANISARYLFGAPMAGAQVRWLVQHRSMSPWELEIPNTDNWEIGGYDEEYDWEEPRTAVATERVDSLDAGGALDIKVAMPVPTGGRAARTGIIAVVSDANRQTVTAGRSVIVHPAAFYIAAKTRGEDYFWRAGTPVEVDVIAVRPTGERVSGVAVQGAVIRREWHQVRRTRGGQVSDMGGWVSDTVATCRLQTAADAVPCRFTPAAGGSYMVALTARDPDNRVVRTTLWRWAAGQGFVPWRDDAKLRIDIIADKQRYSVGDTATLLIASPFPDVEAWFTLERERVLESRRMRLTSGATTIKIPITEALAPNVFASVLLVRGRSAQPGPLDDPGRPTMRVGYAELRVVPAVKKLDVQIAPLQPEYRPGDTARVRIAVRDAAGRGPSAEVTLWAVDEGVLALTGYQVPEPVDLLYRPRGLGVRLASNLSAVAAQVPEGQKGKRNPGGGGGADVGGVLRSRFQTTAFFLGSVVTDANGNATASAKLPDNLTTFRIMAVAVTAGDRYGSGKSSMLVTRPLVARPSLPRFVRAGDRFSAGVVVNQRTEGAQRVEVEATARGIALGGARKKTETLSGAAGREVRFDFTAQPGDSAHFQFAVRGARESDAVALRIPVRPSYHPLAQTVAGAVYDTATTAFALEQDIDPARSTVEISFGRSTLAVVSGARRTLRVYPWYCTEQISSTALPLIALYRAQKQLGSNVAPATAEADIRAAVRVISRRQGPDGGIGFWSPNDWSTPWLTGWATRVLLEARAAGFEVDSAVFARAADFMTRRLHQPTQPRFVLARWYEDQSVTLSERVAAVDILSRLRRPDIPIENTLLGMTRQMRWEDRVLLAEVLARRGANQPAQALLADAWQDVRTEGRKVALPVDDRRHYFNSSARPAARLLTAALAIEPNHARLGQLVETLVEHGRAARSFWNTQDYGWTVLALMAYERQRAQTAGGTLRIDGAKGTLLTRDLGASDVRDTTMALTGLVTGKAVRFKVSAQNASGPVYYYITIREVPRARPVTPVDRGIQVERWYERVDARTPITRAAAGELVRVKLRITVPADRYFVVLDDPLPAGLEAVDLSLRTVRPPGTSLREEREPDDGNEENDATWYYGTWDAGVWSAFDHKELRDDRVVYSATYLWQGTYTATYLARATTPGTFVMPPAHAEEMYNPAVNGRTGGGEFVVTPPGR